MDTIYNKTVTYDAVPIPKTQHGSYKAPAQKSYSYTEPKAKANQYVNNAVNTNNTAKTYTYNQPKTYTYTPPKTNIGEYKTLGGYTNTNPYVTKDRVGNGQNSYSAQPKTQEKKEQRTLNSSDLWGVPKTIKDGAQPKTVQSDIFSNNVQNYGINREIVQSMSAKTDPAKELYVEYLKRLTENNKGVNREIVATTNPRNELKYNESMYEHDDYNYTPYKKIVVTKDNIYTLPDADISKTFSDVGEKMQNIENKLCAERDNLKYDMRFEYIPDGEERLREINKEIRAISHINKKIMLGIKSGYEFVENDIRKLSETDNYDMIYSKEYSDNLPYTSVLAQTMRAAGQGTKRIQSAVDIVDNIKISIDEKGKFTVSDAKNPNSGFTFTIKDVFTPNGYTESRIVVDKNKVSQLDNVQYDLLKAMDNLKVPDNAESLLEEIAENKSIAKVNKVLGTTGYVIDIVDFMTAVASDYSDDNEIGTDTSKAVFGTVGSWAGDIAGGMAGAKAGAAVGAVFGPVGIVIGGVLGAAFGAYVLSNVMEDVGRYVGEHIYDSDYTIQQYYERGK